ncbi:hypothetical protein [Thermosporothrix hazakensis]|uniref:hypothetical protein n=1 Tax=Thermosporothrix hazakensis TaxID=644383 RepID=UPI000DAD5DF2|nr:hypothetical protein [Thermosporothrix hazakensis]GCE50836.1 hypothetical protein KTH_57050 [Thermosporothrix hazakensis]
MERSLFSPTGPCSKVETPSPVTRCENTASQNPVQRSSDRKKAFQKRALEVRPIPLVEIA